MWKLLTALALALIVCQTHGAQRAALKLLDPVGHLHRNSPRPHATPLDSKKEASPVVSIPELGEARGRYMRTFLGRNVSAFHSLPYAYPPERFQYPELLNDTWTDDSSTYDATYFRDKCAQISLITDVISGSENCLYVSVYTPLKNLSNAELEKKPVMVFIHGGAYMSGEADLYMPTKLMDKDVVVVVVQYRLGTLGFLYSGTDMAPGNMGLMDQITALKWVKNYISHFGGDSELVTLFGQSAGGASTSLLQLSPMIVDDDGKSLVHHFIPMSGSSLEYWTIEHDPENSFRKQVEATDCAADDSQTPDQMVDCMLQKSTDELVYASLSVYAEDRAAGGLGFIGQVPVVQNSPDLTLEKVLDSEPIDIVRSGKFQKVPTMSGSVRDEGSMVIGLFYTGYMEENNITTANTSFLQNDLLPIVTNAFGIEDTTGAVANSFRLGFMPKDVEMGDWDNMVGGLVDMAGMLFLKSGLWNLFHEMQKVYVDEGLTSQLYFYSFEFASDDSLFDWIFLSESDLPVESGVAHADDLLYLFNLPALLDERQAEMVHRLTTIYTNFAKYGNPTPAEEKDTPGQWAEFMPAWESFRMDNPNFMLLSNNITLNQDFVTRWNYNEYGYGNKTEGAAGEQVSAAGPRASATDSEPTSPDSEPYKVATVVLSVVAGCAIIALLATLIIRRKPSHKSLLEASHDNIALH